MISNPLPHSTLITKTINTLKYLYGWVIALKTGICHNILKISIGALLPNHKTEKTSPNTPHLTVILNDLVNANKLSMIGIYPTNISSDRQPVPPEDIPFTNKRQSNAATSAYIFLCASITGYKSEPF